ncbi:MAG TPA: hypothetical protein VF405_15585 [Gammaproteobacteria bacterium]
MSNTPQDESRLQLELAQLRAALRAVEAPAIDEAALRARFREAQRRRPQNAVAQRARRPRRLPLAAAAAAVLAVAGVLAVLALRGERAAPVAAVVEKPAAVPAPVSAFQPLPNSPSLSPSSSYNVVRVRIPLSAFAVVPGTEQGGSIEADLLVGEDGLARAIRFNEADALLVSVADQ